MTNDPEYFKEYDDQWLVEAKDFYLGYIRHKDDEYWYVIINSQTDELKQESETYATYNRAKEQLQSALPDT